MELLGEKLLATFLIVGISLIFGFLPLILAKKYDFSSIDTTQPLLMKKQKKNIKNVVLSFLLNIGGGVLLANSFCHLLPEVREGLEGIDSFLPLAEVIMICGFFFIIFCTHTDLVRRERHLRIMELLANKRRRAGKKLNMKKLLLKSRQL